MPIVAEPQEQGGRLSRWSQAMHVPRRGVGLGAWTLTLTLAASALAQPMKPPTAPPPAAPPAVVVQDVSVSPLEVPANQLLEVTGRVVLRVGSEDEAVQAIEARLLRLGGRLAMRDGGHLRLQVPNEGFDRALESVVTVGIELQRSVVVEDRTGRYMAILGELRTAQIARNRVASLHRNLKGVKDPLQVERALAEADDRVAELLRASNEVQRATSMATLVVVLDPTLGFIDEELPAFELPFRWLDNVGPDRLLNLERTYEQDREHGTLASSVHLDARLEAMRAGNEQLLGGNETALAAGFTLRGVGDTTPVGFGAGLDWKLGGGMSGGFLYDLRLVGGLGTAVGRVFSLGVVTGAGIGGLTGDHIPFGVELPVEAFASLEVGAYARAMVWGRTSWILASEDRQDGSDIAPFGDEFASGLSVLVGERNGSGSERNGLVLGGGYRELLGTHAVEVSLGYGASFLDFD